jgi:hypothetical protein
MTGCYLTSLPLEFMRAVADFDPEWAGCYYIPRGTVKPLPSLLARIWPELDRWKEAFDRPSVSTISVEPNKAAGAFLELLEWLREVLLQDAVFLIQEYPDHPVFHDPVFSSPEFAAFASRVRETCQETHEDSHAIAIQKAVPAVAEKLRDVSTQQMGAEKLAEIRHKELVAEIRQLKDRVDEFSAASWTVTISPNGKHISQQYELPRKRRRVHGVTPFQPAGVPAISPAPVAPVAPVAPITPEQLERLGSARKDPQPPSYCFPRDVTTVEQLLRLWRFGLAGMPSIHSLEKQWRSQWRSPKEKQYFSPMKSIIDEVVRRSQARRQSEDDIAREMDAERSGSLDRLWKELKASRKSAGSGQSSPGRSVCVGVE